MRDLKVEKFPPHKQKLCYSEKLASDARKAGNASKAEDASSTLGNDYYTLENEIARQYFACKVSMVVPSVDHGQYCQPPSLVPQCSRLLTADCQSYRINNLPLDELVHHDFIRAFIMTGSVCGVSASTRLEVDDSAVLHASGRLSLLLCTDTYYSLGLTGAPSTNVLRRPINKYVVHINTQTSGFHPNRPGYTKTLISLNKLHLDMWLTWWPRDSTVCPSSVAKYFVDKGYHVEEVPATEVENFTMTNVMVPLIEQTESNLQGVDCETVKNTAVKRIDNDRMKIQEGNSTTETSPYDAMDVEESSQRCGILQEANSSQMRLLEGEHLKADTLQNSEVNLLRASVWKDEDERIEAAMFLEVVGSYLLNVDPVSAGLICGGVKGAEDWSHGCATAERIDVLHCSGLYPPVNLLAVLRCCREWLNSPDGVNVPWCCICFHDSPEMPFEVSSEGCTSINRRATTTTRTTTSTTNTTTCTTTTTTATTTTTGLTDATTGLSFTDSIIGTSTGTTTTTTTIGLTDATTGLSFTDSIIGVTGSQNRTLFPINKCNRNDVLGRESAFGSACKELYCGCGMVERDHHFVSGGMFVVVLTKNKQRLYKYGSASVRHRYYAKSSNNK